MACKNAREQAKCRLTLHLTNTAFRYAQKQVGGGLTRFTTISNYVEAILFEAADRLKHEDPTAVIEDYQEIIKIIEYDNPKILLEGKRQLTVTVDPEAKAVIDKLRKGPNAFRKKSEVVDALIHAQRLRARSTSPHRVTYALLVQTKEKHPTKAAEREIARRQKRSEQAKEERAARARARAAREKSATVHQQTEPAPTQKKEPKTTQNNEN